MSPGGYNNPQSGYNNPQGGYNSPQSGYNSSQGGYNTGAGYNTGGFNNQGYGQGMSWNVWYFAELNLLNRSRLIQKMLSFLGADHGA